MIRLGLQGLIVTLLLAAPCAAQEWADKMFKTRSHDFGNIARGAKTEFAFELNNLYMGDVHIASIRATCGCTTFRVQKDNHARAKQIPVPVEGQVQAAIAVSPVSLFLGVLEPGQSITKKIVVRGQKPFRIDSINADCKCLQAAAPKVGEAKSLYLVPVTFTAGEKTGRITQSVRIETDSEPAALRVPVYAVVDGR